MQNNKQSKREIVLLLLLTAVALFFSAHPNANFQIEVQTKRGKSPTSLQKPFACAE